MQSKGLESEVEFNREGSDVVWGLLGRASEEMGREKRAERMQDKRESEFIEGNILWGGSSRVEV